jgi:hypothetical protein
MGMDKRTRAMVALYYVFGMEDGISSKEDYWEAMRIGNRALQFSNWFAEHATRFDLFQIKLAYRNFTTPISLVKSNTPLHSNSEVLVQSGGLKPTSIDGLDFPR